MFINIHLLFHLLFSLQDQMADGRSDQVLETAINADFKRIELGLNRLSDSIDRLIIVESPLSSSIRQKVEQSLSGG